jgi:hypothetical protein
MSHILETHMIFMERALDKINGNGKITYMPPPEEGAVCSIHKEEACET